MAQVTVHPMHTDRQVLNTLRDRILPDSGWARALHRCLLDGIDSGCRPEQIAHLPPANAFELLSVYQIQAIAGTDNGGCIQLACG